MKALKVLKRVGVIVSCISIIALLCISSITLVTYSLSSSNSIEVNIFSLLSQTYSSYFFFFFIASVAFPLIAGLIDNKASSVTLSSLSLAFVLPLLIKLIKAMEPYSSLVYEGNALSSCTLSFPLFVAIASIALLLLSDLLILVCSIFLKKDK